MESLDRYLKIFEHCGVCEENAQELVEYFNNYGKKFKNCYFNSNFDNDGKNGIVVIKYSKCPMTEETTNECLSKSPLNFIITIEGFNADGSVKNPLKVETVNYYDSNKKARKIPVTGFEGLKATKDYLVKYFDRYEKELINEEGEGAGTSSGASGSDAGPDRTTGDIAVFAPKLGEPIRRNIGEPMGKPFKRKKKKK